MLFELLIFFIFLFLITVSGLSVEVLLFPMLLLDDQYLMNEMESWCLPQINSKQAELWGIKKTLSLAVAFHLYFSYGIQ